MTLGKASVLVFVLVALLMTLFMVKLSQGEAAPSSPTDGSKVPHYFGPNPNWALSSLTLPDATVTITTTGSHDVTATAQATVGFANGANGVITGITLTNPGAGYTSADVVITGAGTLAAASAVVTTSTAVTAVNVTAAGGAYTKPVVSFTGSSTATATAIAYGGVDAITINTAGLGYTFPTVDFDAPDDPNGTPATAHATIDALGHIAAIVIDTPGSGYSSAPRVVVRDGTLMDPINNAGSGATATATLKILSVGLDTFGAGYTAAPAVAITESAVGGLGAGATATAVVDTGTISKINITNGGSGYFTPGGIKKFQDDLPGLCDPADPVLANRCATGATAKYIPLGVPESKTYADPSGKKIIADEYEIGVVQYRTSFSSSLPAAGTLVRGYVQIETPANSGISQHFPLYNEMLDGTRVAITQPDGVTPVLGVTPPQYLGPTLVATKDKPVRIVFRNFLPTGAGGNLFLPVDTTLMGSGADPTDTSVPVDDGTVMDDARNPICGELSNAKLGCFTENRATLHLHGGTTPWISDGTPHQWITPAGEATAYPQGVSVSDVPDMNVCKAGNDGCQTFYYTNQQSARLMFYHDHAWGITRLNVYAGEAAGYLITDNTEATLMAGPLAGLGLGIPLVIQDKTFVPGAAQLAAQDPTWDASRWGGYGNLWAPHVYMPAQNPGDPSGMSAFGRWMYGPWFWPPASPQHGAIANPYYASTGGPNCDPATAPNGICEPELMPGTPNISVGMESFNDTPIVNGTAYPQVTLAPKTYRFRILSAANDRIFNLQWYVADSTGTEVALKAAEVAAAQTDPNVFPTPDTSLSPAGPSWIQIGTEGGFLPAPAVIPNQPITWITDPTRFDVGNVDKHALLVAPGERADVIVDFSQFVGKTLILYNDAPAAFPARVSSYDYYTGGPDLSPVGAPTTLPGYGPNTRTIMRVTIAGTKAPAFNLTALRNAFTHKANGSGVFESGQHPIIVGQAAYNSAYGTSFVSNGWCNAPGSTGVATTKYDGFARIQEGSQPTDKFGFNTLKTGTTAKLQIPFQPKGMHDEANSTSFDEYGRMQATLGLEAPGANPLLQNIILYPYVNPSTEFIDATNLPKGDANVQAISSATDGTQIWKITHNGVDTHPIHFHLYDVQMLNRVTWDNIIMAPDPNELGWKDTIRVSPLQDTYVALRPIIPTVPWELPNSARTLNPMMPLGSTLGFNNVDANGNPTVGALAITNELVNFGWEYVYHCHILSHEEMDMMRPVSVALPPKPPIGFTASVSQSGATNMAVHLSWTDNSIAETAYVVERMNGTGIWTPVGTIQSPLGAANTSGAVLTLDDATVLQGTTYQYRVVAQNKVGYGGINPAYMQTTVQSVSSSVTVVIPLVAPSSLIATFQAGTGTTTWLPPRVLLSWTDNATAETGFIIERAANGGAFAQIAIAPARAGTGAATFVDTTGQLLPLTTYTYRVTAVGTLPAYNSLPSNTASVTTPNFPPFPAILTIVGNRQGNGPNDRVTLTWTNVANETGYTVQWSTSSTFATVAGSSNLGANVITFTTGNVPRNTTFFFRVRAFNAVGPSAWSLVSSVLTP